MRVKLILVFCLVGCGEDNPRADASHDGSQPEFLLDGTLVRDGEIPPGVELTLNGELGVPEGDLDRWVFLFPSYEAALNTEMVFEARYGDALLDRRLGPRCANECDGFSESPISESIGMCAFPNGELRVLGVGCDYITGACVADSLCRPHCFPSNPVRCAETEKCTRIVTHSEPTFGVLYCAPDGDVALGEQCSAGQPGLDTGYDNCAAGGVCVEGTCVELCSKFDSCSDSGTCAPVAGLPVDFGACL